jgi:hypothetical protein
MDPKDQCRSLFFGTTECPAGQDLSSWRLMEEPSCIDGDYYGLNNAMCLSIDGAHSGQSSAESYDGLPPLMATFDGIAHQMNTGLTFDLRERPVNTITPRHCPYTRNFGKLHGVAQSAPSTETECSNEDEQRHVCQECNMLFRNAQRSFAGRCMHGETPSFGIALRTSLRDTRASSALIKTSRSSSRGRTI